MKPIILASTSPRRKQILAQSGLLFKAVSSNYEEDMTLKLKPLDLAKHLSKGKVLSIVKKYPNHIIIGADTFIALKEELLGKPLTIKKARQSLKKISGKAVSVITGFTIIDTGTKKSFSKACVTKVFIKKLSTQEIENYIKTNEPLDKAGAFAIQGLGAVIVKKIEGDYLNVMGLPLYELAQALRKFDVKIL
ncbi:MAG: MAF protein [Parcubacteria group bacterium GW2011_GWC2_38_7]|nr:MAG: MAF protein [Parcubacteria group bacterium GW2011_GWC2_38_7]